MESSGSRGRNAFLTAAGVLAALAVVAVAARGSISPGDTGARGPGDTLLDILFTLYVAGMAAGAVLFVYLLVLRRHLRVQAGQSRKRGFLELVAIPLVLLAVATLGGRRLMQWERRPEVPADELVIGPGGGVTTAVTTSVEPTAYEPGFAWLPALATVGLVVLAVAGWRLAGRARRRARGELRPRLAAAVARAVDDSLDDLRAEPDPRRAVVAAYARLERVLAAHDFPRAPAEAPLEYLGRMLTELSVGERAARDLTDLFERAKFSHHAVGPEMKERAIAALESVRDDLLAARALAGKKRLASAGAPAR